MYHLSSGFVSSIFLWRFGFRLLFPMAEGLRFCCCPEGVQDNSSGCACPLVDLVAGRSVWPFVVQAVGVGGGGRWARGVVLSEALQLLRCSPTICPMSTSKTPSKLTRAQLTQALDTVPVSHILGKSVSRELTPKQRTFALEVAKGSTGAAAYRKAYSPKGKPKTHGDNASRLKGDERIQAEIQALQLAIKAQEYQTPAALRALVIQSLVGVITNPDSQPGQITAAAKVLGTVTEVAAFTERKEVRTITSSEDARAKIMAELRQLTASDVEDVTAIDADADSLLAELAAAENSEPDETHPHPTPQTDELESPANIHTIPHERPLPNSAATPQDPLTQDDPPVT